MARTVLEVVVAGDAKGLERAMDRAGKSTAKFGKTADKDLKRASGGLRSLGSAAKTAGGLLAGAGLASGLKGVADAALESEKSTVKLKAQLKASGISYKKFGDEIDRVIQKQSRLAALDDEDLQDAFTNIVRATGDVEKSMRLVGLAADFARGKNIDVAKAGEIVAKVAGGNTGVLSRYGIQIEKGATATQALGVLQQRFAGQAEAYGKSSAGAMDRFNVASENLKEKLGAALLPAMSSVANAATKFVTQIESGTGAGGRFAAAVSGIADAVKRVVQSIGGFVRGFREGDAAMVALGTTAAALVAGFVAFKVITTVVAAMKALKVAVIAVNVAMRANPFVLVATLVAALGAALVIAYKKSETFRDVVNGVFRAVKVGVGTAISFVLRRIDDLLGAFSSTFSFAAKLPYIGDKFKGIADKVDGAREKIRGLADGIDAINRKPVKPRVILTEIDRAIDRAGSLKEALKSSDITLTAKPQGDGVGLQRPPAGSGLNAFNSLATRFGVAPGSGLRPGARTVSGNLSYHAMGMARDFNGPRPALLKFFRYMKSRYGSRLAELIYTPGGVGIKNGQPHRYTGKVAATHNDHVHVAMRPNGAQGDGDGPGRYVSTAYGPPWNAMNGTGVTANGTDLRPAKKAYGIAVDPKRIRLGSKLYAWPNPFGHRGKFTAFDTGGAIKGNRIDFYDWRGRKSQMNWGRRPVTLSASAPGGKTTNASGGVRVSGQTLTSGLGRPGGIGNVPGTVTTTANPFALPEGYGNSVSQGGPLSGTIGAPTGASVADVVAQQGIDAANAQIALAALTPEKDNDITALGVLEGILSGQLNSAIASGNNPAIAEIANALKGVRDQIKELGDSVDANTAQIAEARADAERQLKEQSMARERLSQSQYGVLVNALSDLVNGNLGGRVGLGFQSVGWAGGGVRY